MRGALPNTNQEGAHVSNNGRYAHEGRSRSGRVHAHRRSRVREESKPTRDSQGGVKAHLKEGKLRYVP